MKTSSAASEININDVFCWTDSKVALAWIKATTRVYKTFVQNRVNKIRKNCAPEKWGYCNSKDNPADLITRFNFGDAMAQQLWKHGPDKLMDDKLDVEKQYVIKEKLYGYDEIQDNTVCMLLGATELNNYYDEMIGKLWPIRIWQEKISNCLQEKPLGRTKQVQFF